MTTSVTPLLSTAAILLLGSAAGASDVVRVVSVDRDNVLIRESCMVEFSDRPILDADGNGVVQIVAPDITVTFGKAPLHGAELTTPRDLFTGTGVVVSASGVTLRGLKLDGFKVGLLVQKADGVTLEDLEILSGYSQRLRSTPSAEDGGDWLWPHTNDAQEWRRTYGAGIAVEESSGVTIRRVIARNVQNGIILDRVNDSRIYDNDCSFLSGWGLAMWRSNRTIVSRNAFDFCVRGYSHGVYNRGQDSAGILLFEQCSGNVFAENSATHGGDGLFGFGGKEALGEHPRIGASGDDVAWHTSRGCNANIFINNDFSFAAAHGLELTFSFDNRIEGNRFVGNAICGIWGGYSQRTTIGANRFADNGGGAYGLERGGINIEHGVGNVIAGNVFEKNACGVHLWNDADEGLMKTPWARANDPRSRGNAIVKNRFTGDAIAIQLRETPKTVVAENRFVDVGREIEADAASTPVSDGAPDGELRSPAAVILGERQPVGARRELAGREKIVMTEWGPYDWVSPRLQRIERSGTVDRWQLLGKDPLESVNCFHSGDAKAFAMTFDRATGTIEVRSSTPGSTIAYGLSAKTKSGADAPGHGFLVNARWRVTAFPWSIDPRDDRPGWLGQSAKGVEVITSSVDFRFGNGGPVALAALAMPSTRETTDAEIATARAQAKSGLEALPADRFGIIATTTLRMAPGGYRFALTSDDGVRLTANGEVLIDNWTWHAPTTDRATLVLKEPTEVTLVIEHFELDGFSQLSLEIGDALFEPRRE